MIPLLENVIKERKSIQETYLPSFMALNCCSIVSDITISKMNLKIKCSFCHHFFFASYRSFILVQISEVIITYCFLQNSCFSLKSLPLSLASSISHIIVDGQFPKFVIFP